MDFKAGNRVVTVGQTVPPSIRGKHAVVREIDEGRARPVVVNMLDESLPEDTNHSIISFYPNQLRKTDAEPEEEGEDDEALPDLLF